MKANEVETERVVWALEGPELFTPIASVKKEDIYLESVALVAALKGLRLVINKCELVLRGDVSCKYRCR